MSTLRAGIAGLVLLVAVLLQVTVFPLISYQGVVPDVVLMVVVAGALARGPELAMLLGFAGGLLIDLAPPADHVAGRWALSMVVAGYLAGRVRRDADSSVLSALLAVALCSFVATSLFALGGMLIGDPDVPVTAALRVVPVAVGYDVLLAPFFIPPLMRLLSGADEPQAAY